MPRPRQAKHLTPAQGGCAVLAVRVRPRIEVPLLHDQRRKRVHACCGATRSPTGTHEDVEKANWDVLGIGFSKNGQVPRHRDQRGRPDGDQGRPRRRPASGWRCRRLPSGGVANVTFAKSETQMAFYVNADRSPNDLFVLTIGAAQAGEADELAQSRDRRRRSRRHAGRPLQGARWHDHPEHPLETAPGDGREQGAGDRLGARRSRRADDGGLQRGDSVPGQPRLRRPRDQQPRQLRLRQDVLCRRRPEARPRAAVGLRGREEVPREPAVCGRQPRSGSSAAATAATWCSPRWRFSPRCSTSASTSSASRTGCARSRASRRGGKRSARRSTPRSAIP